MNTFQGNRNLIHAQLPKLRAKAGLTEEALAERVNALGVRIARQAIIDIETNRRKVRDYELCAISQALGVRVADMFA